MTTLSQEMQNQLMAAFPPFAKRKPNTAFKALKSWTESANSDTANDTHIFLSMLASHLFEPFLKKNDVQYAHKVLVWQYDNLPDHHVEKAKILERAERIIDMAAVSRNVKCLVQARETLDWKYNQLPANSPEKTDFSGYCYVMEASDKICVAGLNIQKPEGFKEAVLALKWQYDQIPENIEEKDIPLQKVSRLIDHMNRSAVPERFGGIAVLSKESSEIVKELIRWQQGCREGSQPQKTPDLKQKNNIKTKIVHEETLSTEERINLFLTSFNQQLPQSGCANKLQSPTVL